MIETIEEYRTTFPIDANVGSFRSAQTELLHHIAPDPSMIRVEDFIHATDDRYRAPTAGNDLRIHVDGMPSPYRDDIVLLRIGLQTRYVPVPPHPPTHLLVLLDLAPPSDAEHGLLMVRDGLRMLVEQMSIDDQISLVAAGPRPHVVLQAVHGNQRARILAAIDTLTPEEPANLDATLALASEVALATTSDVHRIVLCSTGNALPGPAGNGPILERASNLSAQGISVSTIGLAQRDALMEHLSTRGRGLHAYVDRRNEIGRAFAELLAGQRLLVGQDAKIQVEFNPTYVERFRQFGYASPRRRPDELDVTDPQTAPLGSNHSVTSLYELQLVPNIDRTRPSSPLGTVQVRYRDMQGRPRLHESDFDRSVITEPDQANASLQVIALSATLAERLAGSYWAREVTWSQLTQSWDALPPFVRRRLDILALGQVIRAASELDPTPPHPSMTPAIGRISILK